VGGAGSVFEGMYPERSRQPSEGDSAGRCSFRQAAKPRLLTPELSLEPNLRVRWLP
jgi:hypothetical protein